MVLRSAQHPVQQRARNSLPLRARLLQLVVLRPPLNSVLERGFGVRPVVGMRVPHFLLALRAFEWVKTL